MDGGGAEKRSSRLAGLGNARGERAGADWGACMPELLASVVVAVSRVGGLASFGRTSDQGALSVTIFLDGERTTVYIKPSEDVDAELEKIIIYMDALA